MYQSAETILGTQLDPGEHLLWCGQPRGGVRLHPQDLFMIPFSLVWGGFAFFWEFTALTAIPKAGGPVSIVFPLFGLPFVIAGLYMIFGRFFVDAWARDRTIYGVTSERVIIVSGLFSQQTKSLQLRTLAEISLTQRNDGSGNIAFGPSLFMNSFFMNRSWPGAGRYGPPSFDMIDGVKQVYDIIRNAQRTTPLPS